MKTERERDRESEEEENRLKERDGQSVVFPSIFTVLTAFIFVSLWWI